MQSVQVVQIVGARPQFMKLAPVSRALRQQPAVTELIVHTGQHYDPQLSDVFFSELSIPPVAVNLEIGSGSHAQQTGAMLVALEEYLRAQRPDAVVIYGDTNSTLAGALSASKLHIPVVHVEAGLRSFNRQMPEELNRVVADHLSDLLLAPTEAAMHNLGAEGLSRRARLVGDVMYDVLLANKAAAVSQASALQRLQLGASPFGLVTVHRAESTTAATLAQLLQLLGVVAQCVPLVFPVHPRTRAALAAGMPQWQPAAGLRLIDPVGPLDMLQLTAAAAVVLTDSGGLQKEAFMLGCPCVTLRGETEWVETVTAGANVLVGHDTGAALSAVQAALRASREARIEYRDAAAALYGGGEAATHCAAAILELARG